MNNSASNIQATVQELKYFCEHNFFRKDARTIVHAVVGLQSASSLTNRIHPKDLLTLSDVNLYHLFELIRHVRETEQSIIELFGRDWIESIYMAVQ